MVRRGLPSIKVQIYSLVWACALPAIVGFALLTAHFIERERDQIKRDTLITARALMLAVDRDLNTGITVALALANSPSLDKRDFAAFHAEASKALRPEFPGFNFVLSDRDSVQLLNTVRPYGPLLPDPGSAARIRKVFETGKPVISDVFIGGALKRPLVAIHAPVLRDGKVVYCISSAFVPERLGQVLKEQRLQHDRVVAVFDSQGVIVARSLDAGRTVGKKGAPSLLAQMQLKQEAAVEATTLEGLPVYSMYSRSPFSGWTVVIGVPRSVVWSEMLASIKWISFVVGVLLAAGFCVAWIYGRKVGRSVEQAAAAKDAFVANMSHELRTPMNAVLGMAHLMTTTPLSLEQRRYLTMLRTSGQSLLALLNDILDFSKIEAGKIQLNATRFELDAVLHSVSTIMSVNAGEKELELAIGVEPDVPRMLVGDPLRLQQILVNLTSNAIKFTARGEVSLKVECAECTEQRSVMRFIVRDTGIGISLEQKANLFAPFAQADESVTRKFGGTGLGLVICQRLVELQGGSIELDSSPGEGSTFTVTLPFGTVPSGQQQASTGAGSRPLRVLVVDDHFTSRVYLSKTLQAWGWGVDVASSSAEAQRMLDLARQRELPYDVILADWSMPTEDQHYIDSLRHAEAPGVPVILMVSAYERSKMLEEDADREGLVTKPITASTLFDTVHEVLDKADTSEPPADDPPAQRLNGHLLLVEDNAMNQLVAVGILERAGATIEVANNGEEAVRKLRAAPDAYRLVLMDVQMPVMDGYTATRIIRQELGLKLPIVAMTAGVMESERADCLAAGMDDFIPKPLDIDEMMQTLERFLAP